MRRPFHMAGDCWLFTVYHIFRAESDLFQLIIKNSQLPLRKAGYFLLQ